MTIIFGLCYKQAYIKIETTGNHKTAWITTKNTDALTLINFKVYYQHAPWKERRDEGEEKERERVRERGSETERAGERERERVRERGSETERAGEREREREVRQRERERERESERERK